MKLITITFDLLRWVFMVSCILGLGLAGYLLTNLVLITVEVLTNVAEVYINAK